MPSRAPRKPRSAALRRLPAVETVLQQPALREAADRLPRAVLVEAVRDELKAERARLARNGAPVPEAAALAECALARATAESRPTLRRVLNATGIVLHTNLGRAPLSDAAARAVGDVARGYCSLEFELATGRRGGRAAGVERWLTRLTGAEAALVVNNGAGAVLLALSALAAGRGVIVSRGELVEIGGEFRIPEILEKSGARLIEVGTTNRTHLRDYEAALARNRDVAAILRVHPSNFRIAGFVARPELPELAALARRRRVTLIEDLGSGALVDLAGIGIEHEPTVRERLTGGCDVVTFSGDKLLGATQAGLVLGRKRHLDRIRRDPLARALRVDKLALAALEATLPAYADPPRAIREIPALAMLAAGRDELEARAERLKSLLAARLPAAKLAVAEGHGEAGGGSLPLERLPGFVVTLEVPGFTPDQLDARARSGEPPVIGYIRGGRLRLDPRTLRDEEIVEAAESLGRACADTAPRQEGE
ncbi:MAG TPA: L-seryl-tRNA(Sec) selenium transferase [Candidatus Eisenbacteria bacterium]|nr:L-seryl-tRNA(Sec) selenium transferase [Candidatus Eisenbacteria bacterium]